MWCDQFWGKANNRCSLRYNCVDLEKLTEAGAGVLAKLYLRKKKIYEGEG